jgi:hypothetical protein
MRNSPKNSQKKSGKVASRKTLKFSAATTAKKTTLKSAVKSTVRTALKMSKSSKPKIASARFAGISLGGGKTENTAVAILEYFPEQKRVFLRSLVDKIKSEDDISADLKLHELLTESEAPLETIAFDVPLQLPKCIRCQLKCPGIERCKEPEIKWMWGMFQSRKKSKRPNRLFTPYTERCVEMYINTELEESFHPSHALGSNAAPLAARAHFISRRLTGAHLIEVNPKLSLWRIGRVLKIPVSHLRFHRHAVDSDESRLFILKTLVEKNIVFLYQQDMKTMVETPTAFDAFLAGLTCFLDFRNQSERPPPGFPKGERWITFPKQDFSWF